MSRLLRPRWILIGVAVLAMAVLGGVAFVALEPSVTRPAPDAATPCSPKPCTAPGGFELYMRNLNLSGGTVTMEVSFKNRTTGGGMEAVTYRHTSPVDFQLRHSGGANTKPFFDATCPNWEEARVERGGAEAGPDRLCFNAPASGLQGYELLWMPDEGVFPIAGSISLG